MTVLRRTYIAFVLVPAWGVAALALATVLERAS